MKIRPYITFNGNCQEAINLYKLAFRTDTLQIMRFQDLPEEICQKIPDEYLERVVQVTLKFGDDFIRMSDCGPMQELNAPESERISIAVETNAADVQFAFDVLAREGNISMPLEKTFYSTCAGVVVDKFGVIWNFVGQ